MPHKGPYIRPKARALYDRAVERNLLDELSGRWEETVLILRYRDNFTLQEIADKLGVTRERIRQIESKALTRLRQNPKTWNEDGTRMDHWMDYRN